MSRSLRALARAMLSPAKRKRGHVLSSDAAAASTSPRAPALNSPFLRTRALRSPSVGHAGLDDLPYRSSARRFSVIEPSRPTLRPLWWCSCRKDTKASALPVQHFAWLASSLRSSPALYWLARHAPHTKANTALQARSSRPPTCTTTRSLPSSSKTSTMNVLRTVTSAASILPCRAERACPLCTPRASKATSTGSPSRSWARAWILSIGKAE